MENIVLKQIDILRDEIRWWMNIVLVTMSAFIGGIVSISQNKLTYNVIILIIGVVILIFFVFSILKINKLQQEQQKLFDKLRRKKWK